MAPGQKRRAIFYGIVGATVLRIFFASITLQLLSVIGLLLAGGILLLWVAYKMWREIRLGLTKQPETVAAEAEAAVQGKTMRSAITSIVVADVSMSLDNVLAVAGAATMPILFICVWGTGKKPRRISCERKFPKTNVVHVRVLP